MYQPERVPHFLHGVGVILRNMTREERISISTRVMKDLGASLDALMAANDEITPAQVNKKYEEVLRRLRDELTTEQFEEFTKSNAGLQMCFDSPLVRDDPQDPD